MTVLAAAVAAAALACIPASAVMKDALEAEVEVLLADPGTLCGAGRSRERVLCPCVCTSDCLEGPGCGGGAGRLPCGEEDDEEEAQAGEEGEDEGPDASAACALLWSAAAC